MNPDWYVVHTRPRCEKKLVQYCQREHIATTLPCIKRAHKYRGKTATFQSPLFPGYVFIRITREQRQKVYQSDYAANVLEVFDQAQFEQQLNDILRAVDTALDVRLAPQITPGSQVRVKSGPLRGILGWVEKRSGMVQVLLRLDFIGQAAAVSMDADELELA
jgi:transcription antitermination factor NusG